MAKIHEDLLLLLAKKMPKQKSFTATTSQSTLRYQRGEFPCKLAIKFFSASIRSVFSNDQQESKNAYKTSERLEKS